MKTGRLDHIVLAVRDLKAAADAWSRAFDLRAQAPFRPEGSDMDLALMPLADAGAFLELVQPATPGHHVAKHLEEQGEGLFSISVEVADLDAAVAELKSRGLAISGPETGTLPDTRVARIPRASAHGVAIQLIERA